MAPSLACDLDGDGDCDLVDIDELSVAIVGTSADLKYDLDKNGRVDQSDIDAFLAHEEVNKLNGDSDFNGLVEFADFLVISGGFGGQGRPWSQGDFVADGAIDFADFLVISGNFGQSAAASAVPEPQAVWLFLGGICVLFQQRRKIKVMQVTN